MTSFHWRDMLNSDNEFNISPEMWSGMNSCMTQDEIIEVLQDAVDNTAMPFPYRKITLEQATEDFRKLRFLDTKSLVERGPWKTRYDYCYGSTDISVAQHTIGLQSSNYFHQRHRYDCDNNTRGAASKAWLTRKTRREMFKPLWTLEMNQVKPRELRSCCRLRTYVAAQFRPSVAKFIYDRFGGGRVLDFSAGWGDRLSAALASSSVTHYTGIDPNTNLHPGYRAQIRAYNRNVDGDVFDWFGSFTPKTVRMIHSPAEDADLGDDTFDIVFTSPPYFDKEYYSKEETQSWKRYKTSDAWLSGFMYPVVKKVWDRLRPGGHLCINILDIKNFNPSRRVEICDPMNDYIRSMPGAQYQGAIGMKMSVRPNLETDTFCEPVWVWRKG